jgi:AcrR family transcriptional regulator
MVLSERMDTTNRILDRAEAIYATEGLEGLSLRAITEVGDIDLPSVNNRFSTRMALIEGMLLRFFAPIDTERLNLLRQLETDHGAKIRPTHVMSAVLLPLLRELTHSEPAPQRILFFTRAATDPAPVIRNIMMTEFKMRGDQFDSAFVKSASELSPEEVIWRTRLFCNALPGTISNHNAVNMCITLLAQPGMTTRKVLIHFCTLLERLMSDMAPRTDVPAMVDESLDAWSRMQTVRTLTLVRA